MYGDMPWFCYPISMPMPNKTPVQAFHSVILDVICVSLLSLDAASPPMLPTSLICCLHLQAQAVQAQPIPALYPSDNTQLEESLLARCRPPPNVQLFCPECIPESLATAITSSPAALVVIAPLRLWYGNAGAMVMVVVVMMSRGVQWQLAHYAP